MDVDVIPANKKVTRKVKEIFEKPTSKVESIENVVEQDATTCQNVEMCIVAKRCTY